MNSRNGARRHKGRHRQTPRATPDQSWQEERKQNAIEALCHPVAAASLRFWTAQLPNPLFVYFIQAETGGPVKIGQAQDPIARLRELQCGNWQRLVVRSLVLADIRHEKWLHRVWRDAAIRGEWFGNGYEEAILAHADEASQQQLTSRRLGEPVEYVLHVVTAQALRIDVISPSAETSV